MIKIVKEETKKVARANAKTVQGASVVIEAIKKEALFESVSEAKKAAQTSKRAARDAKKAIKRITKLLDSRANPLTRKEEKVVRRHLKSLEHSLNDLQDLTRRANKAAKSVGKYAKDKCKVSGSSKPAASKPATTAAPKEGRLTKPSCPNGFILIRGGNGKMWTCRASNPHNRRVENTLLMTPVCDAVASGTLKMTYPRKHHKSNPCPTGFRNEPGTGTIGSCILKISTKKYGDLKGKCTDSFIEFSYDTSDGKKKKKCAHKKKGSKKAKKASKKGAKKEAKKGSKKGAKKHGKKHGKQHKGKKYNVSQERRRRVNRIIRRIDSKLNDVIVAARATNKAAKHIKISLKLRNGVKNVQAKIEKDLKKLTTEASSLPRGNPVEKSINKARKELKRALDKSKRAVARLTKRCNRSNQAK
jgi:hypothetical protein